MSRNRKSEPFPSSIVCKESPVAVVSVEISDEGICDSHQPEETAQSGRIDIELIFDGIHD